MSMVLQYMPGVNGIQIKTVAWAKAPEPCNVYGIILCAPPVPGWLDLASFDHLMLGLMQGP